MCVCMYNIRVVHNIRKIYIPYNFTNDWFRHNMVIVTLLISGRMETEMKHSFTAMACELNDNYNFNKVISYCHLSSAGAAMAQSV
jgi:hypothetical protein